MPIEAFAWTETERRVSSPRGVITCDDRERKSRCEDASVTEQTLARARAGDEDAFRELTDPYRRELQLHVYRIVGSAQDAEDLLQETLLAAWRGLERFEETRVGPCLAVPDRHESLAGCPPCEPAPPGRLAADDRGARADAPGRADLA
jgi:hypothetical protein